MKTARLLSLALLGLLLSPLLPRSYAGGTYETLFDAYRGTNPASKLVLGSDGSFYGTTLDTGTGADGTVFKLSPTGVLTTVIEFDGANGSLPYAGLVLGSDGNFYGTTRKGGAAGYGTAFKLTPAGVLTTLVNFDDTNGSSPVASVVEGSDGNFYGTTSGLDGLSGNGTVFKMTPAGVLTTLVNFSGANGSTPKAGLWKGSDGNFYGTTAGGGTNSKGTVFKMTPAGALTTLVNFDGTNGFFPEAGVIEGSDGNFYGTTSGDDAANDYGTVFKMTPAGALTTLVNFAGRDRTNGTNGANPSELLEGSDGNFYGTTSGEDAASDYGTVFKMTPAGTLTTLVSFDGLNGQTPSAGLILGSDGNFYGTTAGVSYSGSQSAVFKMTPAGALTTLVSFTFNLGVFTGLEEGSDGNFYVTTIQNGTNSMGMVLQATPTGGLKLLVNFDGTNGANPSGGLLKGSDGNLYGMTNQGGANGVGTVFKMTPAGVLTTLMSFDDSTVGSIPYDDSTVGNTPTRLVEGSDGNFYGTTTQGGANGKGTIFKMTPAGAPTVLTAFDASTVGPSGLVEGGDGNFYGTTYQGGANGLGSVFKMTPAGVLTTLVDFDLNLNDGGYPLWGLIVGSDGNFYGTTAIGGATTAINGTGVGTVFKMTPTGVLTTLASLDYSSGIVASKLVKGSDGNIYGTTLLGGPSTHAPNLIGTGTFFRVTPAAGLSTLVDFAADAPGTHPTGILLSSSGGNFYGVAAFKRNRLFSVHLTSGHPTLTAPVAGTVTNGPLSVAFTLPENAQPGSVNLTFGDGFDTFVLTLAGSEETSGAHSFTFDTGNPTTSPKIASGSPLTNSFTLVPYFSATLSYRDMAGNPGERPFVSNLVIDRKPPQIVQLDDVVAFASDPAGVIVNYDTPQASDDYQPGGVVLSYSQASGTLFSVGTTKVTVTAEDLAHNQSTMSFKVKVHGPFPEQAIVLAKGDPAPGRATVPGTIGVPPEDAVVASFGVPAIDDAGNLAFTAKWTSAKKGKGSGLFTETACLGVAGNAVPNFAGSTFKGFGDPVISEGNVACLATLKGTVKGTAVIAGPVGGPLTVITHIGSEAPGVGAPFKSIKAIEASADHVAFLATAGKFSGLWVKDGANPLALALLQGQTIGSKTIKQLTSFAPGNSSPGCGRGWLQDITGQQDTAQVLALCLFTDKSQAVVAVKANDVAHPVMLSQSGAVGPGGPAAGGSFASYGLPTANASGESAFLASLPIGGTVTKANQRGVYTQLDGSGTYTLLAQTGDPAGTTGGNFSLLKDPVLASDGGLAFPATIKGGTVKGAAMQTLWWLPPGGTLKLLAQGGSDAADLTGAKWKAFSSLAIAPACPVFAATLTPNKTNVTKTSANGVWAMDTQGHLRLLFRTGATIGGKQVKSFMLLNATVGSMGVTRSFNATPRVVWLAASFTDKSQAIVTTDLP